MAAIAFTKAVKYEAKGRIALIGPAGSGKSFTMLVAARALAGPNGKIAAIDTEAGSLSKYAHTPACGADCKDPSHFDFDVCPLSDFTAPNFLNALAAAEKAGYAVFCCDSLSHFWMGSGGTLEFVDSAAKRSSSRDGMSGWKEWRPFERQMTEAMIASPCHIICTMRTKTAYEEHVNPQNGKKQRVKIGLAPVQRDGLEYEFDLVGSMDEENALVVDKTRCSSYAGKAITKPAAKDFLPFRDWLMGAPKPDGPQLVQQSAPPATSPAPVQTPPAVNLEPERVKWLDLIAPTDSMGFLHDVASKITAAAKDFIGCSDEKLLAVIFNRLPDAEVFSAFLVPLQKIAFDLGRKDFIKAVSDEAKRRGYTVNRTAGTYEEGASK